MVTLVVLNYNDSKTTTDYLQSIENYQCFDHIVVVDNCSTDNSYEILCRFSSKKISVIRSEKNGGYGYGNNCGIKYATSEFNADIVLVTNPDVRYDEKVVMKLEKALRENEKIAIAAPKMTSPEGRVDMHTAWAIPTGWQYAVRNSSIINRFCKDFFYKKLEFNDGLMDVGTVAGSMLMIKTKDFYQAGCYDEKIFLYCEETVLGIKIKRINKRIVLLDDVFVHYHSVSINKNIKSFSKRERIMWDSRKYVLKNYYDFTHCKMIVIELLQNLTIITRSVGQLIR